MTREEALKLQPGDRALIRYFNNITTAEVVEVEPMGSWGPQLGWVKVRHISDTAYGDRYAGAEYEAACEYMARESEPVPPPHPMWAR